MSNRCAPCPSSQPQQEAMLLDTSQPGTSNFMVPSQNTEPGTDLASSSTSDPQTNTLQNINSVVQQNQLQATISFESLLLDKVNKHPKPVPPQEEKLMEKVSKKSKENKPPNGNHGSPKINRCKQISKSKSKKTEDSSSDSDSTEEMLVNSDDSDSIDIVPAPDYIHMLSAEHLHKNDFILAKFRGGKRSSFIYRYVCSVLNIYDSGEIKVMGLISTSTDKDKFRKVVSDVS
nr:unnamed protein product [Callosobruchus analis]